MCLVSSDRLAEILDVAEDGIVTVNADYRIVLFNRGATKIFGYLETEIIGQPLDVLIPVRFHGMHRDQVEAFAGGPVASRIMGERRTVVGHRKDGSEFPAEITISRLEHPEGRLITAIIRDAAERRRYEDALLRLNHELEERVKARTAELAEQNAQREAALASLQTQTEELRSTTQQLWQAARLAGVGELAAGIAHELNNPLGIVSLRIEGVLARTPLDDPRRRPLEVVEQEVERMARLVSNLLNFSRPGRDRVSTVEVCDELVKTIELTEHHFHRRGVQVVTEFGVNVPTIHADRQQLRQVFLNLFTNAADAMPAGGTLTLRVRTSELPDGRPAIVIEVTDTGVGIPEKFLSQVLDPFFSTKEEGQGTGLGLAICKRIIDQHNGSLVIESHVGSGTTVRATLPRWAGTNVEAL